MFAGKTREAANKCYDLLSVERVRHDTLMRVG